MTSKPGLVAYFIPSIRNIFFLACFFGVLMRGNVMLNEDGDLGHHLASGRLILQTGQIYATDPFSFRTEGVPAIPHEWAMQVLFAAIDNFAGLAGIVFLSAIIIAVAFTIVFLQTTRKSNLLIGLFFAFLALGASTIHWITRPHLITFLIFPIWLLVIERFMQNPRANWWIFPLISLVWANVHGMFVIGILTLLMVLAALVWDAITNPALAQASVIKYLLLALALSIIATFINPSGWHTWDSIFNLAGSEYITSITPEYRSADFHTPVTWLFLLILGMTLAAGLAGGKRMIPTFQAFLAAGWAMLGIYSSRNIPLAAIVLAPIAAELTAAWLDALPGLNRLQTMANNLRAIESQARGWLWASLGVLAAVLLMATGSAIGPYQLDPEKFPLQAVNWLEKNPQTGHMFNEFDWGGYLLYRLWPEQKIFMDGHTHIYGDARTREYGDVILVSKEWRAVLEKYAVQWVIIRTDSPLDEALSAEPGWKQVYRDPTAVIFSREK
jgi:hypothetical protein